MKRLQTISSTLLLALSANAALAQVPEYTPEQVLSLLDRQIRSTLQFKEPGVNQQSWLSLTYVGLEVPKDDPLLVDLIAVQCPAAANELTSYSTARRLDQIYELILNKASLSVPNVTIPGLDEAQKTIRDGNGNPTPKYLAHLKHRDAWLNAANLFDEARRRNDTVAMADCQNKLNQAEENWVMFGFKTEMEAAVDKMLASDANGSILNTAWRRQLLNYHRNRAAGGSQGSFTTASIAVPRSTLHPAPDKWTDNAGWTKVAFKKEDAFSSENDEYRKKTRYGSAGGGFLFWSASASKHSVEESQSHREVKKASKIAFEFELRRAIFDRPWLDQRFFFEPGFWTWLRPNATPPEATLPRVSLGTSNGFPVENGTAAYIDTPIPIPMVPSEVVVARKLKLTMTVSNSDFQSIKTQSESSANANGRAFFFFRVSGGGSDVAKISNVQSSGGLTTFDLSFEGPVVIGFISNVVPQTPEPKKDGRQWPAEAWGAQ